jgi:hypothetical protein
MLKSCTLAQAVSCRPLTMEAWILPHYTPCGFLADRVGQGQVFLQELWFSPVSIITPMLHTDSSTTATT